MNKLYYLLGVLFLSSCTKNFSEIFLEGESISAKRESLATPYVTAGDKTYLVGHMDGTFPALGWHIPGEMGGLWMHPIKLFDGFSASLEMNGEVVQLDSAIAFRNFPYGNILTYKVNKNVHVERFQFVPDGARGIVVYYEISNSGNEAEEVKFDFKVEVDLQPTWLGEKTGMIDSMDVEIEPGFYKDLGNAWFAGYEVFGAKEKLKIPSNGRVEVQVVLAGSTISLEELKREIKYLSIEASSLLEEKKNRMQELSENSVLSCGDAELETVFKWLQYNTDWLVRDVPGVGRGIGAGIPDYPWWFGVDSEYTLLGLIRMGHKDLVYSTIELLAKLSEETNSNGRIIHEASTNGYVFNPGNTNETPQWTSLIRQVYDWTGDKAFLEKYYPLCKKGMEWLMETQDEDGNGFPDGFGMMEIHGMDSEMIDVAVYTQRALDDLAYLALCMGDTESTAYLAKADALKTKINTEFWVEEAGSFADYIGNGHQTLTLIEDAIKRAEGLHKPWAVEELNETRKKVLAENLEIKKGRVLHHNWVVNTPMETGIADSSKAILALDKASTYTNPFGLFVTGIDRDQSAGADMSSMAARKKVFDYVGAVMTLPTGVLAIGENSYSRPDKALDYLKRMCKSFSYAHPGSMYEVSPDFGMLVQAWNAYSFGVPVVSQFFGIQPRAAEKIINIKPQFPSSWENAELKNVHIGINTISIKYSKKEEGCVLEINQSKNWEIRVDKTNLPNSVIFINGKSFLAKE